MVTTRLVRVGVLVLLCLQAGALAQGDERARELLEGVMQVSVPEFHTLQQELTMTMADGAEITIRNIVDYDNRRAIISSDLGEMQTTMRHVDGKTQMIMDGELVDLPSLGVDDPFALIFEPAQFEFDVEDATYDGFVSYGGLVSGEQVTTTGAFAALGLPEDSAMSYVFDENGEMLAGISYLEGGTKLLILFGATEGVGNAWNTVDGFEMVMYEIDGENATPYATMEWKPAIVDEPLDESLFD